MVDNAMDSSPTRSSALAIRNRVSRHFPQTLRLDADTPHWKTERVRVA